MKEICETINVEGGHHVKMWTRGVTVDDEAKSQRANFARQLFVPSHLTVMPDVHVGKGAGVVEVAYALKQVLCVKG